MTSDSTKPAADIMHWAKKVSRRDIQRLYESDAAGLLDEELLDRVFASFGMRIADMFEVREAQQTGRVHCRSCGMVLEKRFQMGSRAKEMLLSCEACGWQVTCGEYYASYTGERMLPGSVPEIFEDYQKRSAGVHTPQEKLLLIDWLIHEFHENLGVPGRPVGENLISGSKQQVGDLIQSLACGPDSTLGLSEQDDWLEKFNHPVRQFVASHSSAEIDEIARRLHISVHGRMNKNRVVQEIFKRDPSLIPDKDGHDA